jgi:hypothetical protein
MSGGEDKCCGSESGTVTAASGSPEAATAPLRGLGTDHKVKILACNTDAPNLAEDFALRTPTTKQTTHPGLEDSVCARRLKVIDSPVSQHNPTVRASLHYNTHDRNIN